MEKIRLASSGRETTRLGYGCSSIMGALGRRQSLRLLEAAYDAGIRHFDVAPMYGYGEAESCLGDLRARHDDITITTKYGIAPPKRGGMLRTARRIVGPVLQRVPALKRRLTRAAGAVAAPAEKSRFSADEARASLENSLRALRTNFIDAWLLHEAEASDLSDNSLLDFLHDAVAQKRSAPSASVATAPSSPRCYASARPTVASYNTIGLCSIHSNRKVRPFTFITAR